MESYIGTPVKASPSPIPAQRNSGSIRTRRQAKPRNRILSGEEARKARLERERAQRRDARHAKRGPNLPAAYKTVREYSSDGYVIGRKWLPSCTHPCHFLITSRAVSTIKKHVRGECRKCSNCLAAMLLDDLEKALFVLPSWGSGNASAEIIRFEGEDAEKAFEARKLKNSRNGCATYIRVKLTGDRLVLVVPKQEPHGFNPISPSKVLCELFAAEVDPNGYSVTFDKASAAAVKDHFAEADKADVGADAIGLTAAGSMASAPTNPGVASMNPDVMEEPPQSRRVVALLHGSEQIADLPVPVAESPGAVRIGHPERGHLVEYLAPNSVFNSLPRQRSSPHLRPDDRLVTIDRVFHHASLGAA